MVSCAILTCYDKATTHVGIALKVRKICIGCYDKYFRGGISLPELKKLNPQELLGDDRFTIPLGETMSNSNSDDNSIGGGLHEYV